MRESRKLLRLECLCVFVTHEALTAKQTANSKQHTANTGRADY